MRCKQVGAVISNPEVQGLVPVLLGGIAHPDTKGRCASATQCNECLLA